MVKMSFEPRVEDESIMMEGESGSGVESDYELRGSMFT